MTYVECQHKEEHHCSGWVDDTKYSVLRLPKKDAEGNLVKGPGGGQAYIHLRIPHHSSPDLESEFDPTGLVGVRCAHGLAEHPDPELGAKQASRGAVSWVRGKYARPKGCVIDEGKPAPEDLTIPANA